MFNSTIMNFLFLVLEMSDFNEASTNFYYYSYFTSRYDSHETFFPYNFLAPTDELTFNVITILLISYNIDE